MNYAFYKLESHLPDLFPWASTFAFQYVSDTSCEKHKKCRTRSLHSYFREKLHKVDADYLERAKGRKYIP